MSTTSATPAAADVAALAGLARLEAGRQPPRSPERRAAAHLYHALTVPPAASIEAARRAVATFGDKAVQGAALALLDAITTERTQD